MMRYHCGRHVINGSLPLSNGRVYNLAFIFSALLIMTGCGTTYPTTLSENLRSQPVYYKGGVTEKQNDLLIILRYPALVDPKARSLLKQQYLTHCAGCYHAQQRDFDVDDAVNESIVKTSYYVMELYHALTTRLPPHSVALQPQKITLDSSGKLSDVEAIEFPPAVVLVDFFAYVDPRRITAFMSTYGRNLAPFIYVRTSALGLPHTGGMLIRMEKDSKSTLKKHFRLDGGLEGGLGSNYLDVLKLTVAEARAPLYYGGAGTVAQTDRPMKSRHVLSIPILNYAMPDHRVVAVASSPAGDIKNPPSKEFMGAMADATIDALNQVDHTLATRIDKMRYIARFDPLLAKRWPRLPVTRKDTKRLALINQFQKIESRFLDDRDKQFLKSSYEGAFGRSVRQRMVAELNHQKKHKAIADQAGAMIIFSGLVGLASGTSTIGQMQSIASQAEASTQRLTASFNNHFNSVLEAQVSYVVRTTSGVRTIKAQSLSELRRKMKRLYVREFGDSDQSSSALIQKTDAPKGWLADEFHGCLRNMSDYKRDASLGILTGTWTGPCVDGKLHGYGAFRIYLDGHMIYYEEGEFANGDYNGLFFVYLPSTGKKTDQPLVWAAAQLGQAEFGVRWITVEGNSEVSGYLVKNMASDDTYLFHEVGGESRPARTDEIPFIRRSVEKANKLRAQF